MPLFPKNARLPEEKFFKKFWTTINTSRPFSTHLPTDDDDVLRPAGDRRHVHREQRLHHLWQRRAVPVAVAEGAEGPVAARHHDPVVAGEHGEAVACADVGDGPGNNKKTNFFSSYGKAKTREYFVFRASTQNGFDLHDSTSPCPSCPLLPSPQVNTSISEVRATMCVLLTDTYVQTFP